MPRVRFHDRRHTHATWRIAAGHPISAGSERLGHAKVSITLDTYAHIVAKPHDRAAEVVSALLFGPSENPDKAAVVSIAAGAETEDHPYRNSPTAAAAYPSSRQDGLDAAAGGCKLRSGTVTTIQP